MENTHSTPATLWAHAFERVRHTVPSPIVWLAMQAAEPITMDGNFFVVGLPPDKQYLGDNLKTFEVVAAIEEALHQAAGHILAFRSINGTTVDDWHVVKEKEAEMAAAKLEEQQVEVHIEPQRRRHRPDGQHSREIYSSWDKLGEHLAHMYKTAPAIKYPHGQARYVMEAIKYLSDTIDIIMPDFMEVTDDAHERALARFLERLSGQINLDAIFLSLELYRYRQSHENNE